MDRKLASEIMPIIQAYSEGKVIEMSTLLGWVKQDDLNIDLLIANPNMFRIQPMITYRPFKDGDECWNEMFRHQPFGWINKMEKGQIKGRSSIEIVREDGVVLRLENGSTMHFDFKNLTDISYCFPDGTPLGIREEV